MVTEKVVVNTGIEQGISRREKRQYKKRKHKALGSRGIDGLSSDEESSAPLRGATSTEPDEQEDDGPFAFRRNRLCSYHKVGIRQSTFQGLVHYFNTFTCVF